MLEQCDLRFVALVALAREPLKSRRVAVSSKRGMFRPEVPRRRTLLRELGLGPKLSRLLHRTLIRRALRLKQIRSRLQLKQTGSLDADRECVGMASEAFDHGMPMGAANEF
jgi:hypothetical protein